MMPTMKWPMLCGCLAAMMTSAVWAGRVDFESLPSGAPTEAINIGDQYQASAGMSFRLEGGGAPVLAQAGAPGLGFMGYGRVRDTAAPGQNVGAFFLVDDGLFGGMPAPLIISYATPSTDVGGAILDIDRGEAWTIEARDGNGTIIEALALDGASAAAGDALATPWFFSRAMADIASVRIAYSGPADLSVGFAFDNLTASVSGGPGTPRPIPLPPAVWSGIGLLSLLGVVGWSQRRVHTVHL